MSTYAISDVHGCFEQLQALLDKVSPTEEDQVYLLGDMLDRGPQSAEALVWATTEAPENFHFLLGNHEDMAGCVICRNPVDIKLSSGWDNEDPWAYNGGWETADQLMNRTDPDWRRDVLEPWLRELSPFTVVTVGERELMLVHAGFDPSEWDDKARFWCDQMTDELAHRQQVDVGHGFGKQLEQDMIWAREGWYDYTGDIPMVTIFGHTPTVYLTRQMEMERRWYSSPREADAALDGTWLSTVPAESGRIWRNESYGNARIDIDCGCAYGGRLAALRLDDMEEFYVDGLTD